MNVLDDLKIIKKLDRHDMVSRVTALPDQCLQAWEEGLRWRLPDSYARQGRLLILGMGGSAIGGDLLANFAGTEIPKPLAVSRTYDIPRWVDGKTLVLACSYSGNTEETLSAAARARETGARIAVLTSGGKLADWADRNRLPLHRIPAGWPPRTALGYMTFVPLGLLTRLGWIRRKKMKVEEACSELERYIQTEIALSVRTSSNQAKQIALRLKGRLPVLYGAAGWEGITFRWRTQLEENAKTLAFHHIFPEATHNEISGWVQPADLTKRITALFLTDTAVHPRTLRRMKFTAGIVRAEGARVLEVSAPGRSVLSRMLRLIALGDFISVYLGLLYGIDPTPVVRVEALKKFMKRGGA
ncbi:MAG: bifunctional phosphoglucose/phosphomannose isomerase [Candidatus Omnitrophica bacterium]|nr:bifunctional phosphoglucose/phosphomannose isomerase [Candidatus Omnitrophota bacterium]